jgi:hypothetical protein
VVLLSFTSACHGPNVKPWAYLRDILTRLPALSVGQLGDLLPDRLQAAGRLPTTTSTDNPMPAGPHS